MESRIIRLLTEKNRYLEKFYTVNESALFRFKRKNFDNLEAFYGTRDDILNMIQYLDKETEKATQKLSQKKLDKAFKNRVEEILLAKDQLVHNILEQDLNIISLIENEKSDLIRELQGVKLARKGLRAYQQPDHLKRLDEEA